MEPGPIDPSVLFLQGEHVSSSCAESNKLFDLVDHSQSVTAISTNSERVREVLDRAGFGVVSRLRYIRFDRAIITALVERWRSETNTFHLRVGEMTVTLQDVAFLLGLRIDSPAAVEHYIEKSWFEYCESMLGVIPDGEDIRGNGIKLTWLRANFSEESDDDADDDAVEQYCRAYILHFIGTTLLPDTSRSHVQLRWLPLLEDLDVCGTLSWGSAVLAYLYNGMSQAVLKKRKMLCGCMTLLQAWIWIHLNVGRPTLRVQMDLNGVLPLACIYNVPLTYDETPDRSLKFYQNELDLLRDASVAWSPYGGDFAGQLSGICREGEGVWLSRCLMLCLTFVVEMHLPDRVLLQFGFPHHIPDPVEHVDWLQMGGGWRDEQRDLGYIPSYPCLRALGDSDIMGGVSAVVLGDHTQIHTHSLPSTLHVCPSRPGRARHG